MKKLVIDNTTYIVENMIVAGETFPVPEGKTHIEYTGQAEQGDIYDFDLLTFTTPVIPPTWDDVTALQNKMFNNNDINIRIKRYSEQVLNRSINGAKPLPKETDAKAEELLDYNQAIRDNDETLHATPQEAMDALNALVEPV